METAPGVDITVKINSLKAAIEKGKEERVKAQTNKETYAEQLKKTEDEIRALHVEPAKIETVIAELGAEIEKDLAEVEALITEQYRGVM
jgi:septal ring factor EnvC (AmiA/AmiB activator)